MNANMQAWLVTQSVERQLSKLHKSGRMKEMPPILAMQSVVDSTIIVPKLITTLFDRLQSASSELGGGSRPSAGNLGSGARPFGRQSWWQRCSPLGWQSWRQWFPSLRREFRREPGLASRSGGPPGLNSANSFNRPSAGDVGSFLNMPQHSGGNASARSTGASTRSTASAGQLPSGGKSKSYTTERGTTITVGGGSKFGHDGRRRERGWSRWRRQDRRRRRKYRGQRLGRDWRLQGRSRCCRWWIASRP